MIMLVFKLKQTFPSGYDAIAETPPHAGNVFGGIVKYLQSQVGGVCLWDHMIFRA